MSFEEPVEVEPIVGGTLDSPDIRRDKTAARTFVFTSAQSNTKLNEAFFNSLVNYCETTGAELHISRFTYNKNGLGSSNRKVGSHKAADDDGIWFDPRILPYVSDNSLEITPDLVWCGELNIIPTRIMPITGFENYTRGASCIIPHAKMAMRSVPTMKFAPTKFVYTTGAVTARNYIQRAAGQRAEFHHVFGAIVVEVADNGDWWARQINADRSGGFYDLQVYWQGDEFSSGHLVEAITHGDIHGLKLDQYVAKVVWGDDGIVDTLRPRYQFFHDTIDFMPRNHHNVKDPHFRHKVWFQHKDSVEQEFALMGKFLATVAYRQYSRSYVVVSNHDQAIMQWLRDPAGFSDPVNMRLWLELNQYIVSEQERHVEPHPFKHLLLKHFRAWASPMIPGANSRNDPTFLLEDDSFKLFGDIETGLHGHLGPNGARGNPSNLRTNGKSNTGHTHSAGIVEGVYTAGVYGSLDMGYNKGLSSWSHSMVVTYPNGKRAILTIKNGRAWR